MTMSDAQVYGMLVTVIELLSKRERVLTQGGMNVRDVRARVQLCMDDAVAANEYQEAKKREAKAATEAYVPLKRRAYLAGSDALDMAIAAVGKGTSDAKNFRALRSKIRRLRKGMGLEDVGLPVEQPPGQ